ncbi:MAG: hypothetical protein NC247_03345 [Ruminococcus flavefaciens]|nr:hypothetical protein [Ruminococcus flavefaciens]MCM1360573.1 hypothetical protein [Clostridiales bacterium]MCM1435243.1 hypothetical protein [Ruminococcus flavefaciens]
MAIRKDLDDMLNNLKKGGETGRNVPNEQNAPKRKSIYDDMSVDDLLNALTEEKKPSLAENIINDLAEKNNKTEEIQPEKIPEPEPQPEQSETKKKKIVITGELPDYEAIRRQEMERMRLEHERAGFPVQTDEEIVEINEVQEEIIPEADIKNAGEPVETYEAAETIPIEISDEPEIEAEPVEEPNPEKKVKKGLFSKRKKKHDSENIAEKSEIKSAEEPVSDEYAIKIDDIFDSESEDENAVSEPENVPVQDEVKAEESVHEEFINEEESSAVELIDAALAAINSSADESETTVEEAGNEAENISETVEETVENESRVSSLIDGIRENAASAIAELDKPKEETVEFPAEPVIKKDSEEKSDNPIETKKGRITSALTKILDEDTDALLNEKSEKTESDEVSERKSEKKFRKRLYAILGVVFAFFAVIGIITSVGKGIGLIKNFTSGEVKKDGFTEVIYPAVIMDIESFNNAAELTSEQIITASIWSIIMNDEKISKYSLNAGGDTVSISAYDVEAQAVELFGQDLPEFVHTTLGPVESRFYFDADRGAYNVKVKPIIFTYHPEIKSIVKSGSDYTVTVDYVDERPAWMEKSVSKSVEFNITEKDDGTYRINSMKILYMKTSN